VGTILGFDFGEKRIGVAIADEGMKIATPHTVLNVKSRQKTLEEIRGLIREYSASKVVVGLPKTLKNEIGPAAKKVIDQVDWLKQQIPCEWVLWDERFSTREVERILLEADLSRQRRKEVRDQLSAQRILQGYIDFHRER